MSQAMAHMHTPGTSKKPLMTSGAAYIAVLARLEGLVSSGPAAIDKICN